MTSVQDIAAIFWVALWLAVIALAARRLLNVRALVAWGWLRGDRPLYEMRDYLPPQEFVK
jgi:hypothetical protein